MSSLKPKEVEPEELDEFLELNADLIIDEAMKNTVCDDNGKMKPSKEWFNDKI